MIHASALSRAAGLPPPVLATARLRLRAPGQADTAAMLGFLTSDRARFYGGPHTTASAWQVFAAYCGQWMLRGYGMYAITRADTDETIGMAGPYHPEFFDEPEISWLLCDARHEGQGYATEAVRAVLDDWFTRTKAASPASPTSLVSYIHPANAASRAVALRLGAVQDPATISPLEGCDTYRHSASQGAA